MTGRILLALGVALATGAAIAFQSMFSGKAGSVIGPVRTGFLVPAVGGSLVLVLVLIALLAARIGAVPREYLTGDISKEISLGPLIVWIAAAGLLAVVIIGGVSFSVERVGITAGLSAIIVAQLVVGLLIDRIGGADGLAVAISVRRILGIAAMAVGVWLLIPPSA